MRVSTVFKKIKCLSNVIFFVCLIVFPILFATQVYESIVNEKEEKQSCRVDPSYRENLRDYPSSGEMTANGWITFDSSDSAVYLDIATKIGLSLFLSMLWSYKRVLKIGAI